MKAKIMVSVSKRDLKYLLITAIEGGITANWAEVKSYSPSRGMVTLREHNDERDESKRGRWVHVTPETIAHGLQWCAMAKPDEGGWAFAAWLKDRTGDAIIADVILQFAVLREVKYG